MQRIMIAVLASAITGCVTMPPERMPITTEQREFIYDYPAPGKSQKELFTSARNYLAMSYGDSKAVSRVEDSEQGTIIGKAIARWSFTIGGPFNQTMPCASNYDIIFIAKEGKARLQLTLVDGLAMPSCGWRTPPKQDYPQIVGQFRGISEALGKALKNESAVDKLKNF